MNDQNQNQPQSQLQPTEQPALPISQTLQPKQEPIEKIKSVLINIFNKLYSNKMIFWSATAFLGIVFIIIIIGLLFGRGKVKPLPSNLPSSTPFILKTPSASTSSDVVSNSQQKLFQLKSQLNQLDINQERLTPPNLNFDVKF